MIKHILFDCDGVLIDTEIVAAEVVTNWLISEGVDINVETFIADYTGKTFTDILEILKAKQLLAASTETREAVVFMDEEIRRNMRPIVGVKEMLSGVPVTASMVSNSAEDYVLEAIELLEANHIFQKRVFSAEMVPKGKPDPAVYLLALEKLNLNKEEVLVIEDSVAGVTASTAAGLKTVGFLGGTHVRNGHGEKLKQLGALDLVRSHKELTEYLSGI
ncbi:MAG: HAD family phosphatase [Roseivirga sp.]|uniref:HAD family hydrolase n=1 Tax=Roseivirga sp. TaxID=1964215 RepID=UPI001B0ED0E3|nr:HAD family phosphatase [Roseivirga sp.]MBO6497180.1 HAD family phosphatase [Roseivirga sp.]